MNSNNNRVIRQNVVFFSLITTCHIHLAMLFAWMEHLQRIKNSIFVERIIILLNFLPKNSTMKFMNFKNFRYVNYKSFLDSLIKKYDAVKLFKLTKSFVSILRNINCLRYYSVLN